VLSFYIFAEEFGPTKSGVFKGKQKMENNFQLPSQGAIPSSRRNRQRKMKHQEPSADMDRCCKDSGTFLPKQPVPSTQQPERSPLGSITNSSFREPSSISASKNIQHIASQTSSNTKETLEVMSRLSLSAEKKSSEETFSHAGHVKIERRFSKHSGRLKDKNTTCFEPSLKPADIQVVFGKNYVPHFDRVFNWRDVVVVPEILCAENDLSLYHSVLEEIKEGDADSIASALLIPWHGDTHIIANDRHNAGRWKSESPYFQKIIKCMERYFQMDIQATRVNWYRDSSDWKPFHHDAAAIKSEFAKTQNCTVAASLGLERPVTFQHAKTGTTVSVPMSNGSLYAFGSNVNVEWKHGVPKLPLEQQIAEGRISVIAWGWVNMTADSV